MAFLATAVKREVVVVHESIRTEYGILPVGLLVGVVEVDRIVLRYLRDIRITELVHVQPCAETVLLVVGDFFRTVTHRLDTQFGVGEVLRTQHVHLLPAVLESPVRVERDVHLAFPTRLGGDQDHTVCTTATVDSGCRSVLQNLHRLDIIRREELNVRGDHTVHYIQRVVATDSRTDTADTDGSGLTGLT